MTGTEVTLVQAKPNPLDLPLLGQAFFSRELAQSQEHLHASVKRTVALCTSACAPLRQIAAEADVDVQEWIVPTSGFRLRRGNKADIARLRQQLGAVDVAYGLPLLSRCTGGRRAHDHCIHAGIFFDDVWDSRQPSLDHRDILLVTYDHQDTFAMWALGMAYFGRCLVEQHYSPQRVRSAILTAKVDPAMRSLAAKYRIGVVLASTLEFVEPA